MLQIHVKGLVANYHSWSVTTRHIIRALIKKGCDVAVTSTNGISGLEQIAPDILSRCHKQISKPIAIGLAYTNPFFFNILPGTKYKFAIYNYESSIIPQSWVAQMNTEPTLIFPSSDYVKDIFIKNGVKAEKLVVIPHGVDTNMYNPFITPMSLNTVQPFRFLTVAAPHARKGLDTLITAYLEEFKKEEGACLVIKTEHIGPKHKGYEVRIEEILQQCHYNPAQHPEILIVTNFISNIASLYNACNVFVSASHSEGFCLPTLEAMACGKPVIVPEHGGFLQYCNNSNAYLYECGTMLAPASMQYWHYDPKATVGQPSKDGLKQRMREVFKNYATATYKTKYALNNTVPLFSWDNAATQMLAAIQGVVGDVKQFETTEGSVIMTPTPESKVPVHNWMDVQRKLQHQAAGTTIKPRILVKRRACMGDILMTLPTVKALSEKFDCKVDYATLPQYQELLQNIPYIENIIAYDIPAHQLSYNYTFYLDGAYENNPSMHAIDAYAQVAKVQLKDRSIDINITEEESKKAKRRLTSMGVKENSIVIGLHVRNWNFSASRDVPAKTFHNAIKQLLDLDPRIVVLLLGNDPYINTHRRNHRVINLTDQSIRPLIATIQLCNLIICPNSGLMHIAGALHIPMIILEGPFSTKNFVAFGADYDIVAASTPCAPCQLTICKRDNQDNICMKQITVDMIVEPVKRRLQIGSKDVSIIILTYNQLAYTKRCIESVLKNTPNINYELILVDNASTEVGVQQYLKSVSNATVILNQTNVGVGKAWTAAARLSKGKYLCLLNNDTEVEPNWLQHLLNRITSDKQIGIVGCKLLLPNRTTQHCGMMYFPQYDDFKHLNTGLPENTAICNKPLECDAVTGACVITPRDLYFKMGAMEERLFAYYEDTDYSMNLIKHGYKVIYEPKATVMHYVAQTSRTMPGSFHKLAADARAIFHAKWDKELIALSKRGAPKAKEITNVQ